MSWGRPRVWTTDGEFSVSWGKVWGSWNPTFGLSHSSDFTSLGRAWREENSTWLALASPIWAGDLVRELLRRA